MLKPTLVEHLTRLHPRGRLLSLLLRAEAARSTRQTQQHEIPSLLLTTVKSFRVQTPGQISVKILIEEASFRLIKITPILSGTNPANPSPCSIFLLAPTVLPPSASYTSCSRTVKKVLKIHLKYFLY